MDLGTWGAHTHPGLVRRANEDSHLVAPPVFAVADGMGGHASGALASRLCVDVLGRLAKRPTLTREDVLHQIRLADAVINDHAGTPEHRGMGTTLCVLALIGSRRVGHQVLVANVGDSRVLRVRRGAIEQLTSDHTVVQELVDAGRITVAAAGTHPDRHVVTRSLGAGHRLDIDWWLLTPAPEDIFLLASDGLTNEVAEADLLRLLLAAPTADRAASALIDAAVAAGARDNVTAVVVVPGVTAGAPPTLDPLDADTDPRIGTSAL